MQDHYQTLQITPDADQEAIQAAYERLRERHNPAKLEGAAEELIEMAQQKYDEIERAYAVLSDPDQRTTYDQERQPAPPETASAASDEALLDYRPLPPAHGQERPRNFDTQPVLDEQPVPHSKGRQPADRTPRRFGGAPIWSVAITTFIIMVVSLLLTGGGRPRYAADTSAMSQAAQNAAQEGTQPSPDIPEHQALVDQYEGQVVAARQVVDEVPDNPNAWVRLGNALYDRVQVVRELQPDSPAYQEQLPRWIEASRAYSTAIGLGITDPVVHSDMGVSLCYYGAGIGDQTYVQRGLEHTQLALQNAAQNGRALLNYGICLASTQPPRTQDAIAVWRQVVELPTVEQGVMQQAQLLLETYSQEGR